MYRLKGLLRLAVTLIFPIGTASLDAQEIIPSRDADLIRATLIASIRRSEVVPVVVDSLPIPPEFDRDSSESTKAGEESRSLDHLEGITKIGLRAAGDATPDGFAKSVWEYVFNISSNHQVEIVRAAATMYIE